MKIECLCTFHDFCTHVTCTFQPTRDARTRAARTLTMAWGARMPRPAQLRLGAALLAVAAQCGLASGCYLFPGATVGSGGIEHLRTTDAAGCCDACSRCLAWTFHKDPQGPPRTATSRARNRATGAPTKSRPDEQHPVRSHRRGIDLLRRDGGGAQPAAASRWGHLGQRSANATQTLFAEFV